jgi:hypothetical protein
LREDLRILNVFKNHTLIEKWVDPRKYKALKDSLSSLFW